MEIKDVLVSVGVVLICSIAIFTWIDSLENHYGVSLYSEELTTSRTSLNTLGTQYTSTSTDIANSTEIPSGSGEGTQQDIQLTQSSGIISKSLAIFGFVPGLMQNSANIIGVDESITSVAVDIFKLVVGITIAYIIFLGVKSLFGR